MKDRRIGRFAIPIDWVHDRPDLARRILRDVLVLRCECMDYMHAFEYVGCHPDFDLLPVGTTVPNYTAEMLQERQADGSLAYVMQRWRRQDDSNR